MTFYTIFFLTNTKVIRKHAKEIIAELTIRTIEDWTPKNRIYIFLADFRSPLCAPPWSSPQFCCLRELACRGREVSTDVSYESWRNDLAEKCRRAEKVIIYIHTPVASAVRT